MTATGGGGPGRQGVGIQESQQGVADGVPVGGQALVTQSLEADTRYPGRYTESDHRYWELRVGAGARA